MYYVVIIGSNYECLKVFYVNVLGCKIIEEIYRKERDLYKLDLEVVFGY